eukprot:278250_1
MSLDSSPEHLFGFNDEQFSDRVLVLVEGDEVVTPESSRVYVSGMLLCARSEYFRKLLGNGFAESKTKEIELRLESGEKDVVMDLLKFVYSMMCNLKFQIDVLKEISTDMIVRMTMVADRFLFPDVVEACVSIILARDLTVGNCSRLCKLLETRKRSEIDIKISSVTDKVFELHETNLDDPAITGLDHELFRRMISSDTLTLFSENSIWSAIVCWAKRNEPADLDLIQLIECARFYRMDVSYLMNFVASSSYWRPTAKLTKLLAVSLARKSMEKSVIEETKIRKGRNRQGKQIKNIVVEFDADPSEVKKSEFVAPTTWIAGVPFKVYVSDHSDRGSVSVGIRVAKSAGKLLCVKEFAFNGSYKIIVNNGKRIDAGKAVCFSSSKTCSWYSPYSVSADQKSVQGSVTGFDIFPGAKNSARRASPVGYDFTGAFGGGQNAYINHFNM